MLPQTDREGWEDLPVDRSLGSAGDPCKLDQNPIQPDHRGLGHDKREHLDTDQQDNLSH